MKRLVFDQTICDKGKWISQKIDASKLKPIVVDKLRICTYNIWFANERQQIRMQHIVKMMEDMEVDIFCFQEVTQSLLQHILSHSFIQKYYLSGMSNEIIGKYGNVIFSRFPIYNVYVNKYEQTNMDRKLVCIDTIINNQIFRFGTVHLESPGGMVLASTVPPAKLRVTQLKESMKFMISEQNGMRPQNMMIMGDFNECATKKALPMPDVDAQFVDSWASHFGGEGNYEKENPGWTMPENTYHSAWRPDRMYYAFDYDHSKKLDQSNVKKENKNKGQWCLKGIQRIGMDKIEKNAKNCSVLTASDHFGLLAEFAYDKGAINKDQKEEKESE